jgi:hypothetical protein
MRIVPTPEELARERSFVEIVKVPGRNCGVKATVDIPANTMLMVYPGTVTRPASTPNSDYTWAFFKVNRKTAAIDTKYDITANATNKKTYAAPLINEPPKKCTGNVQVVWNLARRPEPAIEYWTARKIKRGCELFVCYGTDFRRNYPTSCARSQTIKYVWSPRQDEPAARVYGEALRKALAAAAMTDAGYIAARRQSWKAQADRVNLANVTPSPKPKKRRASAANDIRANNDTAKRVRTSLPKQAPVPTNRHDKGLGNALQKIIRNRAVAHQKRVDTVRTSMRRLFNAGTFRTKAQLVRRLVALGNVLKRVMRVSPENRTRLPGLANVPLYNKLVYELSHRVPGAHVTISEIDYSIQVTSLDHTLGITFEFESSPFVDNIPTKIIIRSRSSIATVDYDHDAMWNHRTGNLLPNVKIPVQMHRVNPFYRDVEATDLAAIRTYVTTEFPIQMRGVLTPGILRALGRLSF